MAASNITILACEDTPLGLLCLRKRDLLNEPGVTVTEITLNHEFLMSSYHTESERALASVALKMHGGKDLDVLIGGLGLGYTAHEALRYDRVRHVEVVEFLPQVIGWLESGLIPLTAELRSEKRLNILEGDIYDRLGGIPKKKYDVILIDVDHSPDERLDAKSGRFYTREGIESAKKHLGGGGVLGVWSYAENSTFQDTLREVFHEVRVQPVPSKYKFHNNKEHADWLFFAREKGSPDQNGDVAHFIRDLNN